MANACDATGACDRLTFAAAAQRIFATRDVFLNSALFRGCVMHSAQQDLLPLLFALYGLRSFRSGCLALR